MVQKRNSFYNYLLIVIMLFNMLPIKDIGGIRNIEVEATSETIFVDNKWATFLVGPYNSACNTSAEAEEILTQLSKDSIIGNVAQASLNSNGSTKEGVNISSGLLGGKIGAGIDSNTKLVTAGGPHSGTTANGKLTEIPNSYLNAMVTAMQQDIGSAYGGHGQSEGMGYRTFYQATFSSGGGSTPTVSNGYWGRTLGVFSEHCTGCAVDFNISYNAWSSSGTSSYDTLYNGSGEANKEFKWLCDNAYKYGFIWRFKVAGDTTLAGGGSTGTIFEGWHWRFVGVYHATQFWSKCNGYKSNDNYTWEDYYRENIQGKQGYPQSVYDAIVNLYNNDTSKCTYTEYSTKASNNSNIDNNINNISNTNNTLYSYYKGEHGCAEEVRDLKAHNKPYFQAINEYVLSNAESVQEYETWINLYDKIKQADSTSGILNTAITSAYNVIVVQGGIDKIYSLPNLSVDSEGLTGETDEEKIWNFLRSNGCSENLTAGIMGNMKAESSFKWNLIEGGKFSNNVPYCSGGYGLIQWTGATAQKIANDIALMLTNNKYGLDTLRGQLEVVVFTIKNNNNAVYEAIKSKHGCNASIFNIYKFNQHFGTYDYFEQLNNLSISEVVKVFHDCVEISATKNIGTRTNYANEAFTTYTGKTVYDIGEGNNNTQDVYMTYLEEFKVWIEKQNSELKELAKNIWYCWNDDGKGYDYHAQGGGILFEDDEEIIIPSIEFLLTKLSNNDKEVLGEIKESLIIMTHNKYLRYGSIVSKILGIVIIIYTVIFLIAWLLDKSGLDLSLIYRVTFKHNDYIEGGIDGVNEGVHYLTDKGIIIRVVSGLFLGSILINTNFIIQLIFCLYLFLHS